ncbi:Prokaryotic Cytochrome C oxidase subunit IV [Spongiibacter sp. IMCC21906]|uniref:cytochrome C oxidase subunit IV family protein n=1 Tax=Spongiibacter sp. IMCC21906 TaxID=1620392 RepID=UPI00062E0A38|nr:cytochrome C oxidase subunit IV family protein [Spongiibacter sp. IMCC21906]AKH67904.1 Prokaryotic Cytochrome C oxidase subunit IV [Spongiibacter sp. IMCC21906]
MSTRIYGGSATIVWLLLMVASIATTWLLSKDSFTAEAAAVGSIAIAAFKIRLVLVHFMDLKEAPTLLRMVFEAWTAAITLAVIGLYLMPLQG